MPERDRRLLLAAAAINDGVKLALEKGDIYRAEELANESQPELGISLAGEEKNKGNTPPTNINLDEYDVAIFNGVTPGSFKDICRALTGTWS